MLQELSLDAVKTVMVDLGNGQREINIKNYVKIEKLPGGALEDSSVGVVVAGLELEDLDLVPSALTPDGVMEWASPELALEGVRPRGQNASGEGLPASGSREEGDLGEPFRLSHPRLRSCVCASRSRRGVRASQWPPRVRRTAGDGPLFARARFGGADPCSTPALRKLPPGEPCQSAGPVTGGHAAARGASCASLPARAELAALFESD